MRAETVFLVSIAVATFPLWIAAIPYGIVLCLIPIAWFKGRKDRGPVVTKSVEK